MTNSNWNYPTTIWFGAGRVNELVKACVQLGIKKPLFVTDEGLVKLDIVENTCAILKNSKVEFSVFSEDFNYDKKSCRNRHGYGYPTGDNC